MQYEIISCDRWGYDEAAHPDAIASANLEDALNEEGSFSFTVPMSDPNLRMLLPYKREIQIWLPEKPNPFWMGVITRTDKADLTTMTVDCKGIFNYLTKRKFGNAQRFNWLGNGSFDSGILFPWQALGVTANIVDGWGGRAGAHQLNLYQGGSSDDTFVRQVIRVPGGRYFTISADWHIRTDSQFVGPAFDNRGIFVERHNPDTSALEEAVAYTIDENAPKGLFQRGEIGIHTPPGRDSILEIRLYATRCTNPTPPTGKPPGSIIWDNVKCVEMESISFPTADVGVIFNAIVNHAQDGRFQKGSLNIAAESPEITGVSAERVFQYADHQGIGEALKDMATEGLLDFGMVFHDQHTRGLRAYPPKAGTTITDFYLELDAETGTGIKSVPSIETDGSKVVTSAIAQLEGQSGPARDEAQAVDAREMDGVQLEETIQSKVHHDRLPAVAAEYVNARKRLIEVPEVVVDSGLIGKVNLGDVVRVIVPEVTPPEPVPVQHFSEDSLFTITKVLATNSDGNGYEQFDVPAPRVVSIVVNGPYPPNDGYQGAGWSIRRQGRGSQTIVTIHGGAANYNNVGVTVWAVQ